MQLANQLNTPTRDLPGQSIRKRPVPDALDILEQFACTIKIGRTHEIYRHDDPTEFCWKILSGCVRKVRALEDGRRQIREFRWPGDLIGLDDLGTYYCDAEAVTDLTLRRYPRQVIDAHASIHAAFALRLRIMTLTNLHFAYRQIDRLARMTAVERVASFLLEMGRHSEITDRGVVNLPMSRIDIADHLGLSIETVCRNLVGLQRDGTVTLLRSGVELLDRAALRGLACEQ